MIRLSLPMLRFYFSFYWFFCSNVNTISKSIILHYSCDFFLTTLLALCLFITQPCFFFIFHRVVPKPFKFINNGLQANKSLANKSNCPSFLSLCVFLFGRRVGKCSSNFCIIINIVWIKTTTFLNVVIFIQTLLSFVLSIKIINININVY